MKYYKDKLYNTKWEIFLLKLKYNIELKKICLKFIH